MINSISTVNHLQGNRPWSAYAAIGAQSQETSGQPESSGAYTVNISEQAKLANKIDKNSLESYRLPNWMTDFVPRQSILNSDEAIQETRGHLAMLEKITADGEFSSADKKFMQDHLTHQSPATRKMHADAEFRMKYKNELNEYAEILRHAYNNAKQENGIANRDDYINKVLNAPDDNLALRDSLLEKLLDTPRAVELMDMLGIDRPSGQRP